MKQRNDILLLTNESEARLLESVLRENNIPHFIHSYHDTAYDGLFQQQKGWGHVECPPEYLDEVKKIYQDLFIVKEDESHT